MSNSRFAAPLREGGTPSVDPNIGQVDPPAIRAKLMLEAVSHMMTEANWPYRAATISLRSQGDELGAFRLFGANNPDLIRQVFEHEVDISIMNPSAILAMAYRGIGLFSHLMEVALIAVIPHYDQLGFAVSKASGLTSLNDIWEKHFPLRLSVRGSQDACTTLLVEKILQAYGFGYQDIIDWGGSVSYDQPMPNETSPNQASRIGRVVNDELDAIFEEGVVVWANQAAANDMQFLDLDEPHLNVLESKGFRRGTLEKSRFPNLPANVATVDFSGWPIYTRIDTSALLIRKFCEAIEARKAFIPWNFGPLNQTDLPFEKMVIEAADTPLDLPFHPTAKAFWIEKGYLK